MSLPKEKLNKVFFLLSIIIILILAGLLLRKRFNLYFKNAPYSIKLVRIIGGTSHLKGPAAVFFGHKNNLYVVDSGNSRIVKFNIYGKYLRQWGIEGKTTGEFMVPLYGCAHGNHERIFIVDSGNSRVQVFKPNGSFISELGKTSNPKRLLIEPTFLGFAYNRIYIANSGADDIQIYLKNGQFYERKKFGVASLINPSNPPAQPASNSGVPATSQAAGNKTAANNNKNKKSAVSNIPASPAHIAFKKPVGMAFSKKYIYVSDYSLSRILVFDRQFNYIGSIGTPGKSGFKLYHPVGIVYKQGYLYVANYGRSILTVFKLDNGFNVVKAYNFGIPGSGNRNLNNESNISINKDGKYLAVADTDNNNILIYRIFGAN